MNGGFQELRRMEVHWPKSCIECGSEDITGMPISETIRTYTGNAGFVQLMKPDFYFCRSCKERVIKPQIKKGMYLMIEGSALFIIIALITVAIPDFARTTVMVLDFLVLILFGILSIAKIAIAENDLKSGSFRTPVNLYEYWWYNDMYENDGQKGCLFFFTNDAYAKAFLDANPELQLQRLRPDMPRAGSRQVAR